MYICPIICYRNMDFRCFLISNRKAHWYLLHFSSSSNIVPHPYFPGKHFIQATDRLTRIMTCHVLNCSQKRCNGHRRLQHQHRDRRRRIAYTLLPMQPSTRYDTSNVRVFEWKYQVDIGDNGFFLTRKPWNIRIWAPPPKKTRFWNCPSCVPNCHLSGLSPLTFLK